MQLNAKVQASPVLVWTEDFFPREFAQQQQVQRQLGQCTPACMPKLKYFTIENLAMDLEKIRKMELARAALFLITPGTFTLEFEYYVK